MAKYLVKGEKLTALGEAIREQTGKTGLLSLEAMVTEIKNIDFSKVTPINVVPDTASSFTYDGTVKTPVWQNYDPEQLTISGTASATNAGTYTVYFTPKAGYCWSDESVDSKSVTWSIERQTISIVPSQSGTLTYSGSSQSPSWSNYSNISLTIGGTTTGTNAGSYSATFTPTSNYKWSDGTTTAKSVSWNIAKAAGSLSLSATSATVTGKNSGAKTFTVTRAGDGKISVTSSNTGVATASVSGTTVTVTPKGYGSATITVSVAAGTNHNAPGSKTYSFTVDYRYLYKNGTLSEISAFYGKRATVANSGGVLTATSNGNQYCLIYSANMISNLAGKRITVVFNSGTAFYPYEYSVVALASSVPTQDLNNGKVTGLVVSKNINLTGTTGWTQFSGNCSLDIPASLTGSYYLQLSFAGNSQLNGKLVISQIRIE